MKRSHTVRSLIAALCLIVFLGVFLSGCKSREAAAADRLFEQLDVNEPDGETLAKAQEAYAVLSSEDRDSLEHFEKFKQAEAKYNASEVDSLISGIGTVSIESGKAIEGAREAFEALDDSARSLVTKTADLSAAEKSYHDLLVKQAAGEIDALIDAIGEVTIENGTAVKGARSAYDSADAEVQSAVRMLSELEKAEELFHKLEVEQAAGEIDALIDAIGEVTLDSAESIEAARTAFDLAEEEVKAEVSRFSVLTEAEDMLVYLGKKAQAEEMDTVIASLGTITLESENAVKKVREQYEQLPDDIRELVEKADVIDKAEYTIQGLKDKEAASHVKKLTDDKKYDDAITFAEKYIGDREIGDVQGSVVKNTLKAYAAKANALMKNSHYEEAEKLLNGCKERYAGADMADVNKAVTALNKAITEPANGKVFSSKAQGGYCTLKIKAGDRPAFVKVVSQKDPKSYVTLYVRANKSATVHIKNGSYTIKYATGSKWYGKTELFGSGTKFYVADTTLEMTTSKKGNYINYKVYTMTLYSVADGNLTTSPIQKNEF